MPSPISERIARRIAVELGPTPSQLDVARIVNEEVKLLLGAIETLAAHATWAGTPEAQNDIRTAMALVQRQAAGKE